MITYSLHKLLGYSFSLSTSSLEAPYIAAFWVLWYDIEVSDAESFQQPHPRVTAFGSIGALLCIKLFRIRVFGWFFLWLDLRVQMYPQKKGF